MVNDWVRERKSWVCHLGGEGIFGLLPLLSQLDDVTKRQSYYSCLGLFCSDST